MEQAAELALQIALEIDQQIAAGDQIELDERRVLERAVLRKQHEVAQFLFDAIVAAVLDEKALQPLLGHIGFDGFRVAAVARDRERGLVEIARKDLNDGMHGAPRRLLEEEHADAIGLFAGRAADDPDANRRVVFELLEDRRDTLLGERREGGPVAKERGDRDQKIGKQLLGFVGIGLQEAVIGREALLPRDLHAPRDAAQNRRPFVVREVVAGAPP